MRANAVILIVIGLLLLVGTAAAVIPDKVVITGNSSWIVAGSGPSTYTVTVTNQSSGVQNALVSFSVNNTLGTLNPGTKNTDINGIASSIFTVGTKSGTSAISIRVQYNGGVDGLFDKTYTFIQNIDHGSPFYDFTISPPLFTYPAQGTVATPVSFKVSILDKWGNPIDNRTGNHLISLHASSAFSLTEPYFVGYGQDIVNQPLDANGTLSVNVRLTTKCGSNKILMDPFEGKISTQIAWITAVADDISYSMTGSIIPVGPIPANNIDYYTIDYYIYDKYGNPQEGKSIWISTNLSGETTPTSHAADTNGLIRFVYGPKISILTANITAIAQNNASVTKNILAQFVNATATNMVLAVTPQTMASLEVLPTQQAFVRATVIDDFGNPVPNEIVTFSLGSPTGTLTAQPYLDSLSASTDKDGNAIVIFHPGAFPKWGQFGYNSTATGSVPVIATWTSHTQQATAVWKNYPYLSIDTSAYPKNIKLDETIDVSIDVIGNGYLMQGGNVAAIMDLDSSSSIWSTGRMPDAKEAAKAFATAMLIPEPSGNWIGLNSFGNEKKDDDRLLAPQTVYSVVDAKINNLVKGTNSQEFGNSILDSINNLSASQANRTPDKVRAVIVLKDMGGGNLDNSQKPDKNDIISAAQNTTPKTMIFTVYYYDGVSNTTSTCNILRDIADGTGGKFFISQNAAELKDDFIEIATILKTAAGVNATMTLDFTQVEVNGTLESGGKVFTYVPVPDPNLPGNGFADMVTTPKSRNDILGRTRIMWPNSSYSVMNQSTEWDTGVSQTGPVHDPYQLYFNIGTINVSQQWNTTYRLRANQTGLINLFNCSASSSSLSFESGSTSGTENMCLPNLYITVNPNTTPLGLQNGTLSVTNLEPDNINKLYNVSVPMKWDLNYTGFDTVTETYWYSFKTQPFVQFGSVNNIPNGTHFGRHTDLDVKNFPAGEYQIKVIASVPGIPPAEDTGAFTKFFDNASVNIRLQ